MPPADNYKNHIFSLNEFIISFVEFKFEIKKFKRNGYYVYQLLIGINGFTDMKNILILMGAGY